MKKITLLATAVFILNVSSVYSQAPVSWTVDPSAYNNSMTVAAVLDIDSQESRNTADVVAAFIGSDVRGVGSPITPVLSKDRYITYFVIYSNNLNELITFKLYNKATNKVTNSVTLPVKFIADGNVGTILNPLVIKDNNIPIDLTLSSSIIQENLPVSTLIGMLNVTDDDVTDTHVLSLLDGANFEDNAFFEIKNGGVYNTSLFDFEMKSSYTIRVQAEDSKMGKIVKTFRISVIDDDLPTVFTLSKTEIFENLTIGSIVGDFNVVKENRNVFELSLVAGIGSEDNASFEIVNNKLRVKEIFDFENKSNYKIRVQASNTQNDVFFQTFVITVKDDNLPIVFTLSKNNLDENLAVSTIIADFTVSKENRNDFALSLSDGDGGEDNASFLLNTSVLKSKEMFDFEIKNIYRIRVKAENSFGEIMYANFSININDINDIPILITLSNNIIEENLGKGTLVGTFATKDQDKDLAGYSFIIKGVDYKYFDISGNLLLLKQALDFEKQKSFQFDVVSNDGRGGEVSETIICNVIDVNENPVILLTGNNTTIVFSISELDPKGIFIGKIEQTDQDQNDTHLFKIVSAENLPFEISKEGVISYVDGVDYEKKSNYTFEVVVTDNGTPQLSDIITVTVEVVDEIESFLAFNNFVSPNNDGKNDVLKIDNMALYKDYNLSIYNVRGQLLYSVVNYQNDWSGDGLSAGEYYLYFEGKNIKNEPFVYKEVFNLVLN